jgi:hypothetical protein
MCDDGDLKRIIMPKKTGFSMLKSTFSLTYRTDFNSIKKIAN